MTYSLGSRDEEQTRLLWQSKAYGDLENIAFKAGETVVEAGCGVGANLWIVPEFSIGSYIGFDANEEQIVKAKQVAEHLGISNVQLFVGNMMDEGLLDKGIADTLFIRLVLIHLKEPERAVRNLLPVVKSGGRIVAVEPDSYAYRIGPDKENLQHCWLKRCELAYGADRGTMDVAGRLDQLFRSVGLTQIKTRQHLIEVHGNDQERLRHFANGWIVMINSVADQLIEKGMISREELDAANAEAKSFDENTILRQYLTIGEGIVA